MKMSEPEESIAAGAPDTHDTIGEMDMGKKTLFEKVGKDICYDLMEGAHPLTFISKNPEGTQFTEEGAGKVPRSTRNEKMLFLVCTRQSIKLLKYVL